MILLMGVAGSGKSTQGRMLADERGYAWISTGEILRVLITGTRRHEMLEGKLLNDEETIRVVDKVLDLIDPNDEFVLDGFPRTLPQGKWLLEQTKKGKFSRIIVLHLVAKEEVVYDRLIARGRVDDTKKAISTRFTEFKEMTLPILNEFKKNNVKIYEIDASKDADTIHQKIMSYIK